MERNYSKSAASGSRYGGYQGEPYDEEYDLPGEEPYSYFPTHNDMDSPWVDAPVDVDRVWRPKHQCHFCSEEFTRVSDLKKHEATHPVGKSEKPYACQTCPQRFKKFQDLRQHELIHMADDEKLHCSFCSKSFKTPRDLRRHERKHRNDGRGDRFERSAKVQEEPESSYVAPTVPCTSSHLQGWVEYRPEKKRTFTESSKSLRDAPKRKFTESPSDPATTETSKRKFTESFSNEETNEDANRRELTEKSSDPCSKGNFSGIPTK